MSNSKVSKTTKTVLERLITYYGDKTWLLAISLGLVIASSATEVGLLSQIKAFIDTVFSNKDPELVWIVPTILVLAFMLRGLLSFFASYINQWLLHNATAALRRDLFNKLLYLPDSTFKQERSSSVLAKFTTDANNALTSLTELIVTLVREGALVLGIMAYLLWLNWQLTVIVIFTLPIAGLVARLFSGRLRSIAEQTQDSNTLMIGAVKEAVAAQRMIKVHGAYHFELQRFEAVAIQLRRLGMRSAIAAAATAPVTQVIACIGVGVVMALAIYQSQHVASSAVTAGVFTALLSNMVHLFQPLKQLANINGAYARTLAAANSVFEFLDQVDEREDTGTQPMPATPLNIIIENISLQYTGSTTLALDKVSFTLQAGHTTTLLGRSGSGKSSFAALLPRLIIPTNDADNSSGIYINGVPIHAIRLADLRANIAMVTQEALLVDDTIIANVAYGDATPDENKAWAALESAGLTDTVRNLPQGLQTAVGESGGRLSGGQRQRLTIARAFYKDAPLLILDEATSALDVDSEAHVQAALKRLQQGRTCLVITHRLHTIDPASHIVLLEAGRVVEQGSHIELLAKQGAYATLIHNVH